jgi:hypothetical protein
MSTAATVVVEEAASMTCRIEQFSKGGNTFVLRVSGWIQLEHIDTIKELIARKNGGVAFDLTEVTLVERDAVNFLATCELCGIELLNCPAFLREWIANEQRRGAAKPPES